MVFFTLPFLSCMLSDHVSSLYVVLGIISLRLVILPMFLFQKHHLKNFFDITEKCLFEMFDYRLTHILLLRIHLLPSVHLVLVLLYTHCASV